MKTDPRWLARDATLSRALDSDGPSACSVHAAYDESGIQVQVPATVFAPQGGASANAKVARPVSDGQALIDEDAQQLRDQEAGELLQAG
ncbi:hypothetical protein ACWD8L_00290 [Streptomyces sp. NPDC005133]|uniref:hypothetical protein n=1 Tax=Streptomyces sp. NBC_00154 TaxID=2975670 RepID=UPI00225A9CA0|nr:hypothetical protein [Streptomyces sp. NBC_00154]MCX5314808.1 hypothetical protein [Streptomyces sp. NBC_00154]